MRACIPSIALCLATTLCVGTAHADMTNEATTTIRIVVPPMAEAMAAEASGATGTWPTDNSGSGFMVSLPTDMSVQENDPSQMKVFSGTRNRVGVAYQNQDTWHPLSGSVAESDGALKTEVYNLPSAAEIESPREMRLLFSTL